MTPQHPAAPETETDANGLTNKWLAASAAARKSEHHFPADCLAEATARAESAEAAHEAEKAAHERLRAGVEEKIADGPDVWEGYDSRDVGHVFLAESVTDWTAELRALLLGGGEAR